MEKLSLETTPAHIVDDGTLAPPVSEAPTYLPNAHMQHGARCHAKPSGNGCFMSKDQRDVLIQQFGGRVSDASNTYLNAITSMQVDLLVKGDDDLPWLAVLLIDVATAGIASAVGRGLKGLVGRGGSKLAQVVESGSDSMSDHLARDALRAINAVSDKQLDQGARLILDPFKKAAQSQVKDSLALARTAKSETNAELAALKSQVRNGFQKYREAMPGVATDAELLTLFHGFDATLQTEEMYLALLSAKMARFQKSGVTKIGRMPGGRLDSLRGQPELENEMGEEVLRDTRVVWTQYVEGGPRELRYERHDGERVHAVLHPGGEHHPRETRPEFGPARPLTDEPELGRPVPAEFHEAALSRHRQVWGGEPPTRRVQAPYWGFFEAGVDQHNRRFVRPPPRASGDQHEPPRQEPYIDALAPGAPYPVVSKDRK